MSLRLLQEVDHRSRWHPRNGRGHHTAYGRNRGMSDRGHSDEEGRSSLERRSARPYRFANRGRTVRIAVSDLRGKMRRIEQVLGSRLDPALAARIHELEQQGAVDFLTVPIA